MKSNPRGHSFTSAPEFRNSLWPSGPLYISVDSSPFSAPYSARICLPKEGVRSFRECPNVAHHFVATIFSGEKRLAPAQAEECGKSGEAS